MIHWLKNKRIEKIYWLLLFVSILYTSDYPTLKTIGWVANVMWHPDKKLVGTYNPVALSQARVTQHPSVWLRPCRPSHTSRLKNISTEKPGRQTRAAVVRHTFFISSTVESQNWNQETKQDFWFFKEGDKEKNKEHLNYDIIKPELSFFVKKMIKKHISLQLINVSLKKQKI